MDSTKPAAATRHADVAAPSAPSTALEAEAALQGLYAECGRLPQTGGAYGNEQIVKWVTQTQSRVWTDWSVPGMSVCYL